MTWAVHCGDSLDVLRLFPDECFDSMVTDPPAGIRFMGKSWDGDHGGRDKWIAWLAAILSEAYRCLKPGAHCLVWALPRTQHWTQTACEDAGFDVRDVISHMFGSGFPKSLDVSKAIDSAAGAEREVVGQQRRAATGRAQQGEGGYAFGEDFDTTAPATDAAKQWEGFGTALKPSHEAWVLCRKPMGQTVAANVLEHGTGGINVDGCRVATSDDLNGGAYSDGEHPLAGSGFKIGRTESSYEQPAGRWPPNTLLSHSAACGPVCADDCPIGELDRQSAGMHSAGAARTGSGNPKPVVATGSSWNIQSNTGDMMRFGDSGGASRFFPNFTPDPPGFPFLYSAKPSSAERDAGLDSFQSLTRAEATDRKEGSAGSKNARAGAGAPGRRNGHPTVKGRELMQWLTRLVTPPGGTVLDPFCGSGATGIACALEGFDFHGIELDPYHTDIARARIAHVAGGQWDPMTEKATAEKPKQGNLF